MWLLDGGETFPVAAARVGVCARTAYLYKTANEETTDG